MNLTYLPTYLLFWNISLLTGVKLCLWGGGGGGHIYGKMLTFSGKSAERVMGVNEFDYPAIFLGAGALNFLGVIDDVLEH